MSHSTLTAPTRNEKAAPNSVFLQEVLQGLQQPQKELPCKYFYDERGSRLFDQICELEEYYPTRTEAHIMCAHGAAMADCIGPHSRLIEYGSGSSTKTRILLNHLFAQKCAPAAYVPLDISREHLLRSARRLEVEYPDLNVLPVCADYTKQFSLPEAAALKTVVYFPGSTIGNFHPHEAQLFLKHIAEVCGADGGLLIGVDLEKDARILEAAYNDKLGVTADFNLNVLRHINRELGADFNMKQFAHHAPYNYEKHRIEMHLISRCRQQVNIAGNMIHFAAGETIYSESSYKYTPARFEKLAASAGWNVEQIWTDEKALFSVQYLTVC